MSTHWFGLIKPPLNQGFHVFGDGLFVLADLLEDVIAGKRKQRSFNIGLLPALVTPIIHDRLVFSGGIGGSR